MKYEIKQIKIAYHILSSEKLKNNYNKKFLKNSDDKKIDDNYILNRLFKFSQ